MSLPVKYMVLLNVTKSRVDANVSKKPNGNIAGIQPWANSNAKEPAGIEYCQNLPIGIKFWSPGK